MKQFFLCLILLFVIVLHVDCFGRAPSAPECPEDSSGTTYFRDYTDCTKYYQCINKQAVSQRCKDGLF